MAGGSCSGGALQKENKNQLSAQNVCKVLTKKGFITAQKVKEISSRYGSALVGPNCLGVMNTSPLSSMNATFGTQMPKEGNIAFMSQSGALCVAVLDYAKEANVGFSMFISMGNKAGVNENELLLYLKETKNTDVILMYLEDLVNGSPIVEIFFTWD